MDKVQHLWNLVNQLAPNNELEAIGLQSYFAQRCREMESEVELPKKIFGPGIMCSHCGSLWSKVDHKVRFESSRRMAKFIKKIRDGSKKVGKVKETLVKKALRNSGNKAIIGCSFCLKCTKVNMNKPPRLKPTKANETSNLNDNQTPLIKKRKKRTKDKTAGLIITPNNKSLDSNKTPSVKPTNLNKLGAMMNRNLTPSKKSSLHDFIMELSG